MLKYFTFLNYQCEGAHNNSWKLIFLRFPVPSSNNDSKTDKSRLVHSWNVRKLLISFIKRAHPILKDVDKDLGSVRGKKDLGNLDPFTKSKKLFFI